MNVVKCEKGHYFDTERYNRCPHCDRVVDVSLLSNENSKQEELKFRLTLPEYTVNTPVYCCIMHHPKRSAIVNSNNYRTMLPTNSSSLSHYSYPVDKFYVVYNGIMDDVNKYESENGDITVVSISNVTEAYTGDSNETVINVCWDTKVTYLLPITDAIEVWDFVVSMEPINVEKYTSRYSALPMNFDGEWVLVYSCDKDIEDAQKKWLLNESQQQSEKPSKDPLYEFNNRFRKVENRKKLNAAQVNLSTNGFKLKLSYGYFPIHNVEYHNGTVKFYNRINSRDGGLHYPEHFFDEFELILNEEQKNNLNKIIFSSEFVRDFSTETPKIYFDGAPSKSYYKLITDEGITYLIEESSLFTDFFEKICDFPEYENVDNKKVNPKSFDWVDIFGNQTLEIYPDIIRLSIESQNKDIHVEKTSFFVGRSSDCDIQFDESLVSRIHAIFYYNDGTWYIEDLNSKNGVWINEIKLEPMKKHLLKRNDVIDLAHTEKLIFFKDDEDITSSILNDSLNSLN